MTAGANGVALRQQFSIASDTQYEVTLSDVVVTEDDHVGGARIFGVVKHSALEKNQLGHIHYFGEIARKDGAGNLIRKAGVMSIVLSDGDVRPGDAVRVELPDMPHQALKPV